MSTRSLGAATVALLLWLACSPGVQAAEVGYARHGEIVIQGTVNQVEPQRVQLKTSSGPLLWVASAATFLVDRREVASYDLQPGTPVAVRLPAGTSAVLGLTGRTITLQTDVGPADVPISLLGAGALDSSLVSVRLQGGGRQDLTLRQALALVRHAGAGVMAVAQPRYLAATPARAVAASAPLPAPAAPAAAAPLTPAATTGLGSLSTPSTAPAVGLGTMSPSSTGSLSGLGSARASGPGSQPVAGLGAESEAAATVGSISLPLTPVAGVVTEVGPTAVTMRTRSGGMLSVPLGFRFLAADGTAAEPLANAALTVEIPAGAGPILALGNGILTVALSQGVVILPLEVLPATAMTDTRVHVQMANGADQVVPLADAMTFVRNGVAEFVASE